MDYACTVGRQDSRIGPPTGRQRFITEESAKYGVWQRDASTSRVQLPRHAATVPFSPNAYENVTTPSRPYHRNRFTFGMCVPAHRSVPRVKTFNMKGKNYEENNLVPGHFSAGARSAVIHANVASWRHSE
jgi:hypothetical protein